MHNGWVREGCSKTWGFEDDGYCTRCGYHHFKVSPNGEVREIDQPRRRPAPTPAPKTKPVKVTPKINLSYEIEQVVRETVKILAELYEVKVVKLEFRYTRNSSYCRHHVLNNGHTIVIGRCAKWFFENGYLSIFKRCQYTATAANNGILPQHMQAVRAHAAHEVTHAICYDDGFDGRKHDKVFLSKFSEVLELVL